MSQPARFPYLAVVSKRGEAVPMPLLPVELWVHEGSPVRAQGLLDSGATVNVLPFSLGLRLGAVWEAHKTSVTLTGNLAALEARALLVSGRVAKFAPVRLVFAWARTDDVPLILGQVNFFQEFEVSFHGARRQFELQPAVRD
jgi:hypothetical protein